MGYFSINEQGKVNLSLSHQAKSIIDGDMCTFGISSFTTFANAVIAYYRYDSTKTKTLPYSYLKQRKQDMLDHIENCTVSAQDKERVIDCLMDHEAKAIEEELQDYIHAAKGENVSVTLNVENRSYYNSNFLEEDIQLYNGKLPIYLKCLFEEYAAKNFLERERIYRKDVYDKLEAAIPLEKDLEITTISKNGEKIVYHVYPYQILSDATRTQDYLTCFSKLPEQPKSQKRAAAFSIAKLSAGDIKVLPKATGLDSKDLKEMKELLKKNTAGDLLEETINIRIELTSEGEYLYRTSLYNRPTRLKSNSKKPNIYEFQCTPYRALHYFASFGKEAKILSPDTLRTSFLSLYADALKQY